MIHRILVALDETPVASRVLAMATEIAERFDATLLLLRVIDIPPEFPAAAANADPHDALPAFLTAQGVAALQALAAGNPRALVHPPIVRSGDPWQAIQREADQNAVDLIVVGSHAYHWQDRLLGSVAGTLANRGHANVLVVRPAP
jgi:universal stress protein A